MSVAALIRPMAQDDIAPVAALLESLAREHIIRGFSPEGKALFLAKNNAESIGELVRKGFRYHVAIVNDRIVGFVGTRDNSHLYHLFVANEFQRQGLGRRLWDLARAECVAAGHRGPFTVNASSNAVAVYERLGFSRSGPVQDKGGVLFNPMSTRGTMIREATREDFDGIWPIFREIAVAGETYAYQRDIGKEDARALWMDSPRKTYVCEQNGQILGTYYIKTNQAGPGSHVCNCGYMVASAARGQGLATAMCEHSQEIAKKLGYKAMQFNLVASSNESAVKLWSKLGFAIVGRLPKAFHHPSKGYVDALVMYKWLDARNST